MQYFVSARWSFALKFSSVIGSLLLAVAALLAARDVPLSGFAHWLGTAVVSLPGVIAATSLLFVVRGYDVDRSTLRVRRLLWSTIVPLHSLTRVWYQPNGIRCSRRVFGNGGLFAITGVYQNDVLGRFRVFATDPARAVVLTLGQRAVVVTPATPDAFIRHLTRLFPAVNADEGADR